MYTKISSGQYGTATYLIDTLNDVSNLPTKDGVGSAAFHVESGTIYILNGSKEWVEFGGDNDA